LAPPVAVALLCSLIWLDQACPGSYAMLIVRNLVGPLSGF